MSSTRLVCIHQMNNRLFRIIVFSLSLSPIMCLSWWCVAIDSLIHCWWGVFACAGLLYALSSPSVFLGKALLWTYTVARFGHSVAYLKAVQPWRAIFYMVNVIVVVTMSIHLLTHLFTLWIDWLIDWLNRDAVWILPAFLFSLLLFFFMQEREARSKKKQEEVVGVPKVKCWSENKWPCKIKNIYLFIYFASSLVSFFLFTSSLLLVIFPPHCWSTLPLCDYHLWYHTQRTTN